VEEIFRQRDALNDSAATPIHKIIRANHILDEYGIESPISEELQREISERDEGRSTTTEGDSVNECE
jgi:hypothetical protein